MTKGQPRQFGFINCEENSFKIENEFKIEVIMKFLVVLKVLWNCITKKKKPFEGKQNPILIMFCVLCLKTCSQIDWIFYICTNV